MHLFLKIKPQYFFLFAALFFQWRFNQVTPPLQAPDEFNHFYRALQVSEGQFLPLKQNNRLGGVVPASVREFVLPYSNAATNLKYTLLQNHVIDSYKIPYSNTDTLFYDFPNTAVYSPVSYLPHAIAIYVLKKFNVSVANLYYGGRSLAFLFWLAAMFCVISIIPFGKWLATLLMLLPMNLYIANSFSADTVTNIVALLFVAYVLKLSQQDKKIGYSNIFLLLLLIIFLVFAKVVYIGVALILFVIPPKQFKSFGFYALSLGVLFLAACIVTFYWSNTVLMYYTPYADYNPGFRDGICLSNCANYYLQKQLIMDNKWYFIKVIYNSVIKHPMTYLNGYIGLFGNSDIFLTKHITYWSYGIIGFVALTETNKKVTSFLFKIIFVIAAVAAFVLLLLSQHLTWDCVGEGIVDLVQGRYLIPLFPLLFLFASNTFINLKWAPNLAVMLFAFVLHGYASKAIYNRFFVETFTEKTEFYCDAETVNEAKFFTTTNDKVFLDGGANQSDSAAHSGKYSAFMNTWVRYGMVYKFSNLEYGDLIEISGWQKGKTGQLILAGVGEDCGNFYFPNSFIHYRDKNGWGYMNMVKTITTQCKNSSVSFFVFNPDTTTKIYFDDLKFSIKKYKGFDPANFKLK